MKKSMIYLFGLGLVLACCPQFASAQSFVVKESNYPKMKVVNPVEQGKSWNQVTQEVRNPYRGQQGYYPPRPSYGHHPHHAAPPRPPRHHYPQHVVVPPPQVYVPVYPAYPPHGHHHGHHHHHGLSIQIGGPYGGFYFRN